MGTQGRNHKSGNTVGSVTNFSLLGYVDNMPYVTNNEVIERIFLSSPSAFTSNRASADVIEANQSFLNFDDFNEVIGERVQRPYMAADITDWQRLSVLDISPASNDGVIQPGIISFGNGLSTKAL